MMQSGKWESLGNPTTSGKLHHTYPTYLVLFSRIYTRLPGAEVLRSVPNPLSHEFATDGFTHEYLSKIFAQSGINVAASFTEVCKQLKTGHTTDVTTSADGAGWLWATKERLGIRLDFDRTTEDAGAGRITLPSRRINHSAGFTLHIEPQTSTPFAVTDQRPAYSGS